MDFSLTEEQELLRQTARTMLARESPTSLVRAHMDDPTVADRVWKHLSQWTALAEGPLVDLCLFCEETGIAGAPGPFFPTTALFAPVLGALDHPLRRAALAGEVTGTIAVAGRDGTWLPNTEPIKCLVPEADRVDRVAIVSADPATADRIVVRVLDHPHVDVVTTIDPSRRLADVPVPDPSDGEALVLDRAALDDVLDRAVVALSAELVGTARWLFDTTLEYAKQRYQFGRPIGSFQAIQHKLADMALGLERAWAAVYYAAMCHDAADEDRQRATHVAKVTAGLAARRCAKDGIQIHGGIGYTWEHDLHLFIRRAYGSENLLGTTEWHEDRLASLLFD